MPKKPKRRSVASSRAASRKAWRTRHKMDHERRIADVGLQMYRDKLRERDTLPTINRLPKVEW